MIHLTPWDPWFAKATPDGKPLILCCACVPTKSPLALAYTTSVESGEVANSWMLHEEKSDIEMDNLGVPL